MIVQVFSCKHTHKNTHQMQCLPFLHQVSADMQLTDYLLAEAKEENEA